MWGKIIIPMYRLWLHGLYGLYGPWCLLSSKRLINLISLSPFIQKGCTSCWIIEDRAYAWIFEWYLKIFWYDCQHVKYCVNSSLIIAPSIMVMFWLNHWSDMKSWGILSAISSDQFVYVPSQWETTLHCNVVYHWLGAYKMILAYPKILSDHW